MTINVQMFAKKNVTIKCLSVMVGVFFWFVFSYDKINSAWYKLPVIVYNGQDTEYEGPEYIWAQLSGRRTDFTHLDMKNLALYIDAHTLNPGKNRINVSCDAMFLPSTINVLDSNPNNIIITFKTT